MGFHINSKPADHWNERKKSKQTTQISSTNQNWYFDEESRCNSLQMYQYQRHFQTSQISSWLKRICAAQCVVHWMCKYGTLLLAISNSLSRERGWTLFFEWFHVVDGTNVVFDLLQIGNAELCRTPCSLQIHAYTLIIHNAKLRKNLPKSERISDMLCNRICISCGGSTNSLRLQIQVTFNTSSLPNWNLFRAQCCLSLFFRLWTAVARTCCKWLLISCAYSVHFCRMWRPVFWRAREIKTDCIYLNKCPAINWAVTFTPWKRAPICFSPFAFRFHLWIPFMKINEPKIALSTVTK